MTNRVKTEHYVPQFILRHFAIQGDGTAQVWCFDKKTNNQFRTAVDDAAAERGFYDTGDDQGAEKAFSELESRAAQPYLRLTRTRDLTQFTNHDRTAIACLIAIQAMRTRAFRNVVKESAQIVEELAGIAKAPGKTSDGQNRRNPEEDAARRSQFTVIGKATSEFALSLLKMKWALFINDTALPYWTSDSPFAIHHMKPFDPLDGLGFERPGTKTFFPLTPQLALGMFDPREFRDHAAQVAISESDQVQFMNRLQVETSERFLYSNNGDFTLVQRILTESPHLQDPSQKRFPPGTREEAKRRLGLARQATTE